MVVCSVSTCNNSSNMTAEQGIHFYSFPRNENRALEWFIKCKRRDKKRPGFSDRICSIHFHPSAFETVGTLNQSFGKPAIPILKLNATPTINLPYLNILPSEARKLLPPSLARQLLASSKGGIFKASTPYFLAAQPLECKNSMSACDGIGIKKMIIDIPPEEKKEEMSVLDSFQHCQSLLAHIFFDETHKDITLFAQNQPVKAHRVILINASGYIKKTLAAGDGLFNSNCEIRLMDVHHEDLTNLIRFIYLGKVTIKVSAVERFLKAAEALEVFSLRGESERLKNSTSTTSDIQSGSPSMTGRGRTGGTGCEKYVEKCSLGEPLPCKGFRRGDFKRNRRLSKRFKKGFVKTLAYFY